MGLEAHVSEQTSDQLLRDFIAAAVVIAFCTMVGAAVQYFGAI
jgi:hypothetical protein